MIVLLVLGLLAGPGTDSLSQRYLQTIGLADQLYKSGRYESALAAYRQAHELLPADPGPLTGIGWSWLQLGYWHDAETTFRNVLRNYPDQTSAQTGLSRLPLLSRFKLALSATAGFGSTPFSNVSGFVTYSYHEQTTATFGLQSIQRSDTQGLNFAFTFYRRLALPWSARFDFFGLSAVNYPRYWQVVYAPSISRVINTTTLGLTFVGCDKLEIAGLQVSAAQRLPLNLRLLIRPVINRARGRFGWLIPTEVRFTPKPWFQAAAGASLGSINYHADLVVPVIYNQPERLLTQVKTGADFLIRKRFRISGYAAWERYNNHTQRVYPSLTLAADF
jgi:hypothetical protein